MAASWRDAAPADLPVHVVGIGGAGMSGLAVLLAERGHVVSGSDLVDGPVLERLRGLGIDARAGHAAANVGTAALVTASPAVAAGHVELAEARRRGATVASRAEVLGWLTQLRPTLAIAGTHGKTTTTAMAVSALRGLGTDPSFLLGADLPGTQLRARWGGDALLVLEADESYGSFAELAPAVTALANVEADHLDHYGSLEALTEAFADLLHRSRASVVVADDPGAAALAAAAGSATVGEAPGCGYQVSELALRADGLSFDLAGPSGAAAVDLAMPGRHNARNAALALAALDLLGKPLAGSAAAIRGFGGLPRRLEERGELRGVRMVDDYAHLPTEVAAAVSAMAAGSPRRLVVVFQPHRYTRTEAVGEAFATSFAGADHLIVTGLYAAGEAPIPGVDAGLVARAVQATSPGFPVELVEQRSALTARLAELLEPGDLLLTLGAGDLTELPEQLAEVVA